MVTHPGLGAERGQPAGCAVLSDMSVISGTRRGMKELVDGTIRVQIDIDPIHRAEFFAAFSRIDMPVALAPLVANFERIKPVDDAKHIEHENNIEPSNNKVSTVSTTASTPHQKGGELAKWAGILSNDPYWWEWLGEYLNLERPLESEQFAAAALRSHLKIESRAELDHNPISAIEFRNMMGEFSTWKDRGEAA